MQQPREVRNWFTGQRVRALVVDGIVPAGTCGRVRRFYRDTNSLIVLFDGAWDVCVVGGEEVEPADSDDLHERAVGDRSF